MTIIETPANPLRIIRPYRLTGGKHTNDPDIRAMREEALRKQEERIRREEILLRAAFYRVGA